MIMNDFAIEIYNQNYKGPNDETIEDLWVRVAKAVNKVEKNLNYFSKFYSILENFKFVPGGRILANIGIKGRKSTTLYNCFVHHPKDIKLKDPDSLMGIYDMLKYQSQTLKSEGGYGTNFSWIRPNGSFISGVGSRTPGVLRFMELWDKSSDVITSGTTKIISKKRPDEKNKIRKGAQMGVLSIWHPEIKDFIKAKLQPNYLTKFNLSVGVTEGFIEALLSDSDWNLEFPDTEFIKYEKEWDGDLDEWKDKGYPTHIYETLKASELWDLIMSSTYSRNDPGVLFLDLANKLNPLHYAEKIFTSNPCGEILMGVGVCNLGSINLVKFIKEENNKLYFDFEDYKNTISIAVRFLDNINDISRVPLPEYRKAIKDKRRIGLGNMGLGSMLFMLGFKYGSPESLQLIKKIYKLKTETELLESAKLGKEKGSFRLFDKTKYFNSFWWNNLDISDSVKKEIETIGCMRNSHHSMNAPTGNTSILAGQVSNGIEPVFDKSYTRWSIVTEHEKSDLKLQGLKFPDVYKNEWFETDIFKFSYRGSEQILKGTYKNIDYEIDKNRGLVKSTVVQDYGWNFVINYYSEEQIDKMTKNGVFDTANNLTTSDHLNVLKIIAHYTNQNNSKTINLPNSYPYDDFKNIYLTAWKYNIKGITTYRQGTSTAVLESSSTQDNKTTSIIETSAPKRPKALKADFYITNIGKEKYFLAIGLLNNKPYEMFGGLITDKSNFDEIKFKHKKGIIEKVKRKHYKMIIDDFITVNDFGRQFDLVEQTIFRLISASLRHGIPIKFIVKQLQTGSLNLFTLTTAAARILKKYIPDGEGVTGASCPICKNEKSLYYIEGCITCSSCGWSQCN